MEDGTLMIESIDRSDVGTSFECMAKNEAGEAKSRRAVINLSQDEVLVEYRTHQRPRFVRVPTDQEIKEGQSLLLNCNASGDPVPKISWYLNDRLVYPGFLGAEVRLCYNVTAA